MEIYNERLERMDAPDLTLGWLEEASRTVHHAGAEEVPEIWHYEVAALYPNGGRDVRRVIDRAGVRAQAAWDEVIPVWIYHPYTAQELEQMRQEAARPTAEERLCRMEEMVQALGDRLGAMIRQQITETKGGE